MAAGPDNPIDGVSSPVHTREDRGGDEKKETITQVTSSNSDQDSPTNNNNGRWFTKLKSAFVIQPRSPSVTSSDHDGRPRAQTSHIEPPASGPPSVLSKIKRFLLFFGPGAVISVAYIDPDQYQTGITSGSEFQYKLLFMVLVSNIIAVYIQVRNADNLPVPAVV